MIEENKPRPYYWVYYNRGAHEAFYVVANRDDYHNDYGGTHDTMFGEYRTEKEAQKRVAELTYCESVKNNTYCYSHNPDGGRG